MQKWLRMLLSGKDNMTPDIGRILLFIGALAMVFFTGYDMVINKTPFNSADFGVSFAAMLAGGGAGIAVKRSTEPDDPAG